MAIELRFARGFEIERLSDKQPSKALRNGSVFIAVVLLWIVLDRVTKGVFGQCVSDQLPISVIPGVLEISLVHNYGAAWGSFNGMVDLLIVVTAVLIVSIAVFAFFEAKHASLLEMLGLALVFAGGISNLIDRIVNGYVVDLITPLFIDFPTFNIADIGITCGIVIVVLAFTIKFFQER